MPNYRRWFVPGGTYFFTANLLRRDSRLLVEQIEALRAAYADEAQRQPFETVAICVLPNHLHCIWTLPDGDSDFSGRWRRIKTGFSRRLSRSADLAPGPPPRRTGDMATPLLGAGHHRHRRSRGAHRLCSGQSREAPACRRDQRVAVLVVASVEGGEWDRGNGDKVNCGDADGAFRQASMHPMSK
ncbi:MAG: transposase [Qipengyuania sp.]|nr:transposase [Qipengyuania sp.]